MAVVDERLAAFRRGGSRPLARHNAWSYVVGAFDLWLSRARVFYMATGRGTSQAAPPLRLAPPWLGGHCFESARPVFLKVIAGIEQLAHRTVIAATFLPLATNSTPWLLSAKSPPKG